MFDFLKKKKPAAKDTFIEDKEIAYEMAKEYIRDVDGALARYTYWLEKTGKDQTKEEKAHLEWILKRRKELWKEESGVDYDNVEANNKIIKTYSKLMKEYFATFKKGDQAAKEGLPEKFVTTKVDLSEFEQGKGA